MFDINNISAGGFSDLSRDYDQNKINYNAIYRGIVVDTKDPQRLGRVRVRVPSLHGVNPNLDSFYIKDNSLPWATPAIMFASGNDMGNFTIPEKGTRVFISFECDDRTKPLYFGGIPCKIGQAKEYNDQSNVFGGQHQFVYTNDLNRDMKTYSERVIYKSFKGATIIIDDYDGKEYIKIIDQSGQVFEMGNKSGVSLPRRGGNTTPPEDSQPYIKMTNNLGDEILMEKGEISVSTKKFTLNAEETNLQDYVQGGGTGTDNYNMLSNKPQVNSVELRGNKSLEDLDVNKTTNSYIESLFNE